MQFGIGSNAVTGFKSSRVINSRRWLYSLYFEQILKEKRRKQKKGIKRKKRGKIKNV